MCEHEWYDVRYEEGDTVGVYAMSPVQAEGMYGSHLVNYVQVELTNSAMDIFTQASATVALCILSLNLF